MRNLLEKILLLAFIGTAIFWAAVFARWGWWCGGELLFKILYAVRP